MQLSRGGETRIIRVYGSFPAQHAPMRARLAAFPGWAAVIIACHGVAFGLFDLGTRLLPGDPPEPVQEAAFFLLFMPAMALAAPLRPLLWSAKLIEAPGWFTWPKPLGFAMAYALWVAALAAAWWIMRRRIS